MKYFSGPSGFSLLETVIAMGLVGGLAVAVTQHSGSVFKSKQESKDMGTYMILTGKLNLMLSNPNYCKMAVVGNGSKNVTIGDKNSPSKLDILFNADGTELLKKNSKFEYLHITDLEILPLTSPVQASPDGKTVSQYSKLTITYAPDPEKPQATQQIVYPLTVLKSKDTNSFSYCNTPEPWTGTTLGLNQMCAANSALYWDGVSFSCRQSLCPPNTIQLGLKNDSSNDPNCVNLPTNCPTASGSSPTQTVVFFNGSFQCKGTICPPGSLASKLDNDGFVSECKANFLDLVNGL